MFSKASETMGQPGNKYVIATHSLKAQVDEDFQTTQRRTNVTHASGFVKLKDFCSALLPRFS
jgi:hypothetical protein